MGFEMEEDYNDVVKEEVEDDLENYDDDDNNDEIEKDKEYWEEE